MLKKFEVGKEYKCVALYGGYYGIKVVGRTETTISFVYDEETSDDRSTQTAEIIIQESAVYDEDLNTIDRVKTETVVAWSYHSPYAKNKDDVDYGYFFAFDNTRLWTKEEWEVEKNGTVVNSDGWTIRCGSHTYITLEYEGKFVFCLDNDGMYMEEIIERIEKRTRKKFADIPIKGSKSDFDGLRFLNGGFKQNWI